MPDAINARRAAFRRAAERELKKAGESMARLRLLAQRYRGHYDARDANTIADALVVQVDELRSELETGKPVPAQVEWKS